MQKNFYHSIQSVSDITRSIKTLLENGFSFVAIKGEISNMRKPFSGHIYLTLKDEISQIKAVFFKNQQRYLHNEIKNGDQVICRGRISVYEARGDYQLIIDTIDPDGAGTQQASFEQLKNQLSAEGLFDQSHKKELPNFPQKIALITSPQGAAVHDFITIAQNRFPSIAIDIYPTSVQGNAAPMEIIKALNKIRDKKEYDVAVICRGGGSVEDLQAFNDENLARAVFKSSIPVVSAIGHEVDFTILDFVADKRAPTPTAAAELTVPDTTILKTHINTIKNKLHQAVTKKIAENRLHIEYQSRLIQNPSRAMSTYRLRIDTALDKIIYHTQEKHIKLRNQQVESLKTSTINNINQQISHYRNRVKQSHTIITTINPMAILERGYSIIQRKGKKTVITSQNQVKSGDLLQANLFDGKIDVTVK